jgi:hypothetical protein
MQSGGVRALKAKASSSTSPSDSREGERRQGPGSYLESRSSRPEDREQPPASKLIAEAAAAKAEEDRTSLLPLPSLPLLTSPFPFPAISSGAIARGSYVVPTDNPLLASAKRFQLPSSTQTQSGEAMTIQQTIQSVQLLTRSALQQQTNAASASGSGSSRDEARVASSAIYNTGGRHALFSGRGGGITPRRHRSPNRSASSSSSQLPLAPIPDLPEDQEQDGGEEHK